MRAERHVLASGEAGETRALANELRARIAPPSNVRSAVAETIAQVSRRGDAAVVELTRRFDFEGASEPARMTSEDLQTALEGLDGSLRDALETAAGNIRAVAESEAAGGGEAELSDGQRIVVRELPVRRAGVYVPGGRAAYPSTALMCCVPARVAGVAEIAVATPPGPDGRASDIVLAACAIAAADEVHVIGGAQAIAALALGTETVEPVDVLVGPGNDYVQEAKRQLAGVVGIDGIEGPSELVVIAGERADPALVALDVGAQAEHGPSLFAVASPSAATLDRVQAELAALGDRCDSVSAVSVALVEVPTLEAGLALANELAPEHLELACEDAAGLADGVRAAGCVFVGKSAGAAFGDYAAGSNHVLPTGGAARFSGPLGVATFRRRQALVSLPPRAARALAPTVSTLARAEGFPLHAESAEARARTSTGEE